MPLLVPNIGEQESLRYLVNYGLAKPTNLILKLVSSTVNTAWSGPGETDTPTSLLAQAQVFKEPYTYASGGTVVLKDGTATPTVFSFTAPAAAGSVHILIPGEGILFSTSVEATLSSATITVFYG